MACYLQILKKSTSPDELRTKLKALPSDIFEIYDLVLSNIPEAYASKTHRAFQWMAFSDRPHCIEEVAEAAILSGKSSLDPGDRCPRPFDIVDLYSSLVSTSVNTENETQRKRMSFAHHTVKECLLSGAIQLSESAAYLIAEADAQTLISNVTLSYLLTTTDPGNGGPELFTLLNYATHH